MPRTPRKLLVEENSTNHCTWRSHNLEFVLEEDDAKRKMLGLIAKYKAKYGIVIRNYNLMSSHPHVVCLSTQGQKAFSDFWQVVNQCYARWYNKRRGRRGQVVMERLKSPMIQDGDHLLTVMRYVDLNPVRAGMVKRISEWRWSSYRHYAFGEPNALIDDPPEYLALGSNAPARRKAYRALFAEKLVAPLLERRWDLVAAPFVGDEQWMSLRYAHTGLSPPRARTG